VDVIEHYYDGHGNRRVRLIPSGDHSEQMRRAAAASAALGRALPKVRWRRRLRILFTGR